MEDKGLLMYAYSFIFPLYCNFCTAHTESYPFPSNVQVTFIAKDGVSVINLFRL